MQRPPPARSATTAPAAAAGAGPDTLSKYHTVMPYTDTVAVASNSDIRAPAARAPPPFAGPASATTTAGVLEPLNEGRCGGNAVCGTVLHLPNLLPSLAHVRTLHGYHGFHHHPTLNVRDDLPRAGHFLSPDLFYKSPNAPRTVNPNTTLYHTLSRDASSSLVSVLARPDRNTVTILTVRERPQDTSRLFTLRAVLLLVNGVVDVTWDPPAAGAEAVPLTRLTVVHEVDVAKETIVNRLADVGCDVLDHDFIPSTSAAAPSNAGTPTTATHNADARPAAAPVSSRPAASRRRWSRTTMHLDGLTCASCVASVTRALTTLDGVLVEEGKRGELRKGEEGCAVTLLPHPRAVVWHDLDRCNVRQLKERVEDAGFEVIDCSSEDVGDRSLSVNRALDEPVVPVASVGGVVKEPGTTVVVIDDPPVPLPPSAPLSTTTLQVPGLNCPRCLISAETTLLSLPGVTSATASVKSSSVTITHSPSWAGPRTAAQALNAIGFSDIAVAPSAETVAAQRMRELRDREQQRLLWLVIFGAALAIPALFIAMIVEMLLAPDNPLRMAFDKILARGLTVGTLTLACLAIVAQVALGWRVYAGAWRALRHKPRSANMDTLLALGTSAALLYSLASVALAMFGVEGAGDSFFETSVLLLEAVLIGRWLEGRAKARTGQAVEALAGLTPRVATVVDGRGKEVV
ncbi:hypothetical protein HK101_007523, partial [Irineochytrium annulatum]